MNIFTMISGYIFWITVAIGFVIFSGAVVLDKWIAYRDKQTHAIINESRRDIGRNISSSAYWLSDSAYKGISPYVLMREIGQHISNTAGLDISDVREGLLAAQKEFDDEAAKRSKVIDIKNK